MTWMRFNPLPPLLSNEKLATEPTHGQPSTYIVNEAVAILLESKIGNSSQPFCFKHFNNRSHVLKRPILIISILANEIRITWTLFWLLMKFWSPNLCVPWGAYIVLNEASENYEKWRKRRTTIDRSRLLQLFLFFNEEVAKLERWTASQFAVGLSLADENKDERPSSFASCRCLRLHKPLPFPRIKSAETI